MAHHRKHVAVALALNTAVFSAELVAGAWSGSLVLVMDGIHNLSDELALVLILAAYSASAGVSRNFLRAANAINSVGLLLLCSLMAWHAYGRLMDPRPVLGPAAILVGLAAAAANLAIARVLRAPGADNAAVRLAYLHNLGDAWMALAPVAAGVLVTLTGHAWFDPLAALIVALWLLVATAREMKGSGRELAWPQRIVCGHARHPTVR